MAPCPLRGRGRHGRGSHRRSAVFVRQGRRHPAAVRARVSGRPCAQSQCLERLAAGDGCWCGRAGIAAGGACGDAACGPVERADRAEFRRPDAGRPGADRPGTRQSGHDVACHAAGRAGLQDGPGGGRRDILRRPRRRPCLHLRQIRPQQSGSHGRYGGLYLRHRVRRGGVRRFSAVGGIAGSVRCARPGHGLRELSIRLPSLSSRPRALPRRLLQELACFQTCGTARSRG